MAVDSICVFCGSSAGNDPGFAAAAGAFGRLAANRGLRVVYGGGRVGLMGALADAALEAGGEVVGVIPEHLMDREVGHTGLSELRVVSSMHERKATMADLADAFVALPGGIGTLEEFFEVWTWGMLGLHAKPCGVLDVNRYYSPLARFIEDAVRSEFLQERFRDMVVLDHDPERLLDRLARARPPQTPKWIGEGET